MSNVKLDMKHFPSSVCSVCPSCILCEPCSHKHDPSHNLKRTRTPLSVPERGVTPEPRQAKINTCVQHDVVYFFRAVQIWNFRKQIWFLFLVLASTLELIPHCCLGRTCSPNLKWKRLLKRSQFPLMESIPSIWNWILIPKHLRIKKWFQP